MMVPRFPNGSCTVNPKPKSQTYEPRKIETWLLTEHVMYIAEKAEYQISEVKKAGSHNPKSRI